MYTIVYKDTVRQKLTLSLTHSFACSRTSFHFLYLRLMKKYYLSTASAATSAVLLTVSYSFHSFLHLSPSRQLNSALFSVFCNKSFQYCLSIIHKKVFSFNRSVWGWDLEIGQMRKIITKVRIFMLKV